jgi:hypothetical protein
MAETYTYTELHPAEPLSQEPIVTSAISILRAAIEAIEHNGESYNSIGIHPHDYFPTGIQDTLRVILEPVARTYVSRDPKQARDVCGYAAIVMAWVIAGMPESQFAPLIRQYYVDIYKQISNGESTLG